MGSVSQSAAASQIRQGVSSQHSMMLAHGFEYVLLALYTACLAVTDNWRTMSVPCVLEKPFQAAI